MLQVDYLVVADAALAANNRHYIHGTIDVLWAMAVPVTHPSLSIAIRLRVPWNDANTPFPIEIDLVDPDEESVLPERPQGTITMGRPATAIPGEDSLVSLVYNLAMIQFRKPGTHGVVLRMGGHELQRARFQVRLVAQPRTIAPTPPQPPSYTPPPHAPQPLPAPPAQPQRPFATQPPPPPAPLELLPYAPPQQTSPAQQESATDPTDPDRFASPTSPFAHEPPGPLHLPFSLGGAPSPELETPPSAEGATPRE